MGVQYSDPIATAAASTCQYRALARREHRSFVGRLRVLGCSHESEMKVFPNTPRTRHLFYGLPELNLKIPDT